MLAGVGGRTVAEAKARVSYCEFLQWMEYRKRHGALNAQPHIERAAALISYTVSGTVPRKRGARGPRFEDFLPKREDSQPIDIETAMRTWR